MLPRLCFPPHRASLVKTVWSCWWWFPFVLQFFHLFCWLCFKADLFPSDAALRLSFYAQRVRLGASAEAADTTHTTVTTVGRPRTGVGEGVRPRPVERLAFVRGG